jgi:hypothetical protein
VREAPSHSKPATPYTLLDFRTLIVLELSSFALLTLSPLTGFSSHTLISLAGMFLVFSIWALFGFSYPSSPVPIVYNSVSKMLAQANPITLFLRRSSRANP